MDNNVTFTEYIGDYETHLLKEGKIDGVHKTLLYERLKTEHGEETALDIMSNAYKLLQYLSDPESQENSLSKVLCLGKVQSGKTAFFISAISLAFDNGYEIVFLIGGTKTTLKDQNLERAISEFDGDDGIELMDLKKTKIEDVEESIGNGKKVILVVLKNAAEKTNLGKMSKFIEHFSAHPMMVIDDEGDEHTPGAPKKASKLGHGGRVRDKMANILCKPRICTYLSVTATPQANLLLSTFDDLSPDYCVLVNPGKGYTGGNAFHDVYDNPHTVEIRDIDDFEDSIPDTFKSALFFYIMACCLKRSQGIEDYYSMLVHPSSLTAIQTLIRDKIDDYIQHIIRNLSDTSNISYESTLGELAKQYNEYLSYYPYSDLSLENIVKELPYVLPRIKTYEFNYNYGKEDIKASAEEKEYYKIFIGGNMLSRGLTIDNLIVSYVFRDSKNTSIDTLYQRARWFGYKKKYFDVCRVYMTRTLKEKFIATVESENDMWNAINSFLLTETSVKALPRIFTLNNDSLTLTRPSVSGTVVVSRVNPGYSYDKTVVFEDQRESRKNNRGVYEAFINKWGSVGEDVAFDTSGEQTHKLIELEYTDFYDDFIDKLDFQLNSKYGKKTFETLGERIESGEMESKIKVVIMRYKQHQLRSLDKTEMGIRELPQGRNDGTNYDGDKLLPGLMDEFHVQIHLVYHSKETKEDYLPMLAINNPITKLNVRYVTGDNEYA